MTNGEKKINTTLNDVFKTTAVGDLNSAIGSVFYGINHRQQPSPVPINRDTYGLTFFTRPQLNLSTSNLRAERSLIPLLTTAPASIQRIIRCYLDPRLNVENPDFKCPFVDHQNAFMPLLTNHLLTCTGWPDPTLETYTSKPGSHKEAFSMIDSAIDLYAPFDLNLSFRNMQSDPITELFRVWTIYMASVFKGIMVPYSDFLVKNELDYNTRVYRLVLDKNKNKVQKIGCTGAAFPVSTPLGAAFNFDSDKVLNETNNQIAIQLRSIGACYQDDILIHEFNTVVGIFQPSMRERYFRRGKDGKVGNAAMAKVPQEALGLFNNRCYPRIDPNTYELQWYIPQDEHANTMAAYARHMNALSTN